MGQDNDAENVEKGDVEGNDVETSGKIAKKIVRTATERATPFVIEEIPADRIAEPHLYHKHTENYILYRQVTKGSSKYFGIIRKNPERFIQVGDVVYDNHVFVCANYVDQTVYTETTVDVFITLLVKGGSLDDGGERPYEEFEYLAMVEFEKLPEQFECNAHFPRNKLSLDCLKSMLRFFKSEIAEDNIASVVSSSLFHLTKAIVGNMEEPPPPNNPEIHVEQEENNETNIEAKQSSKKTKKNNQKKATTLETEEEVAVELRAKTTRAAALSGINKFSPSDEPKPCKPNKKSTTISSATKKKPTPEKKGKSGSKQNPLQFADDDYYDCSDHWPGYDNEYIPEITSSAKKGGKKTPQQPLNKVGSRRGRSNSEDSEPPPSSSEADKLIEMMKLHMSETQRRDADAQRREEQQTKQRAKDYEMLLGAAHNKASAIAPAPPAVNGQNFTAQSMVNTSNQYAVTNYNGSEPGQPYQQPGQPYQQPGQPYQQPGQPYQQPGQPYQQPGQLYQQPGQPYQQPGQHYQQPYQQTMPMHPQQPIYVLPPLPNKPPLEGLSKEGLAMYMGLLAVSMTKQG